MPDIFYISPRFSEREKQILEAALRKSKRLPEGVNVVPLNEVADDPYVVIDRTSSASSTDQDTIRRGMNAIRNGAVAFAIMTDKVDELAKSLDM